MIEITHYFPLKDKEGHIRTDSPFKGTFNVVIGELGGLTINRMKHFQNEQGSWVKFPAEEYTTKTGEKKYSPIVGFRSLDCFKRICSEIQTALENFLNKSTGPSVYVADELPF
jgi:hypothetical protein